MSRKEAPRPGLLNPELAGWLRTAVGPIAQKRSWSRGALCYIRARGGRLARVLYIVSRENPALYNHLRARLETASVEVTFDRRSGERRQGDAAAERERRRTERRTRSLAEELERVGWVEILIEGEP